MQDQLRITTQANPTKAKKGPRKFNSLPVPPSQLLPHFITAKLLASIPPRLVSNPPPKDLIQKHTVSTTWARWDIGLIDATTKGTRFKT